MANGGEGSTFSEVHGGDGNSGWENLANLFSDDNEAIGNDENSDNDTNSDEPSYDFDGWKPDKDAGNIKIEEDNGETTETESEGSREKDGGISR